MLTVRFNISSFIAHYTLMKCSFAHWMENEQKFIETDPCVEQINRLNLCL